MYSIYRNYMIVHYKVILCEYILCIYIIIQYNIFYSSSNRIIYKLDF